MKIDDPLFTTEKAAEYIGYSVGTLENWRMKNIGPRFYKPRNKVYYYKSALDAWVKSKGRKLKNGPYEFYLNEAKTSPDKLRTIYYFTLESNK